ncbi:DISARM system helicase DrmA [Candidatus Chloroploca sp. M-50]|uniref:DISARM system helicase DrmA n=1 Tax=Candidatus Chloroploca mongolica TaxID=2528176 RepID=A0ABS4D9R0_9CHLR|nr:DISARM system helicase DrmA [Candidatus Chloroploca mongolica]
MLRDLLGPAGGPEEEIAEGSVRDRYLVGMLAPRQQQIAPEEQDDLNQGGEDAPDDGPIDQGATQAPTMFPSSFGMTFTVEGACAALTITASWGRYHRVKSAYVTSEKTGAPLTVWKREPMGGHGHNLVLQPGPIEPFSPDPEQPEVLVRGICRKPGRDWIVTLFLINTQAEPTSLRDSAWIFQPELRVTALDHAAVFQQRAVLQTDGDPETMREEMTMAMLYRNEVEFAVGHGVSVHADVAATTPTCAHQLTTVVVPTYEVPKTIAPTEAEVPALAGLVVDMKVLAQTADGGFGPLLRPLLEAYRSWIDEQQARIGDPAARLEGFEGTAAEALDRCRAALTRIEDGITLLDTTTQAAEAFRFMNRAMWQQRLHTLYAEAVRRQGGRVQGPGARVQSPDSATEPRTLNPEPSIDALDVPKDRSWRPFQLAFILLNLPALTDLHHPDRSESPTALADLLWFPTGGGKTEAYLGLTAYTLGIRRLQGTVEGRSGMEGVAVLMRYTLRLLTLQQFQRAATLICACEMIRREHPERWGSTPFRIGLWVGQRTTPNTSEQSNESLKRDHGQGSRASSVGGSGSPAQLTNCPWCGAKIQPEKNHLQVNKLTRRTIVYCGDALGDCPFSRRQADGEGLPILVVDEDIYRRLPALVIATVDKFAQLPWNGATGMLFGQVDGYCPRHGFRSPDLDDKERHPAQGGLPAVQVRKHNPLRPPDLIIQDELHLISGPLGTLVGLYETAVDRLATWEVGGKRVRPKVIASTATIRRAPDQIHALFLRQVAVFPPQGLEASDNFFARQQQDVRNEPGRRYLGICAIGKRQKAVLIRVYTAFMAAAQMLYQQYGVHVDPWMTLVGYFNAMRELGGMRRLVEDDVRSRLHQADKRGLARRRPPTLEELTSRKGATDIPRILDLLEVRFDPADEAQRSAARKRGAKVDRPTPLDVLLATNMISVGVDVKRLGLMIVSGQPKTTAEYIQATSRVGRTYPGLVCTIFNWARPRDLSHYEQFEHYHATFYQQVEALSVTPFAAQALRRGLAALLVTLVRLLGDEFNANDRAGRLVASHPYAIEAIRILAERAALITGRRELGVEVEQTLRALLDNWREQAGRTAGGRVLGYKPKKDGLTVGLLKHTEAGRWEDFTCLNSLRDVEPGVGLVLGDGDWGMGDGMAGNRGWGIEDGERPYTPFMSDRDTTKDRE